MKAKIVLHGHIMKHVELTLQVTCDINLVKEKRGVIRLPQNERVDVLDGFLNMVQLVEKNESTLVC